jgi:hypothetical protein
MPFVIALLEQTLVGAGKIGRNGVMQKPFSEKNTKDKRAQTE